MSAIAGLLEMPAPAVRLEPDRLAPGSRGQLTISLDIPEGDHIQSHTPSEPFLIPTVAEVDSTADVTVGAAVYPRAVVDRFEWTAVELDVYRGRVDIAIPIEVGAGVRDRATLTGRVRYQRCTATACLPPVEHAITATVDITQARRWTELAHDVATGGPAAADGRLEELVSFARTRAVTPVLLDVVVDPGAADVMRQRALGRILLELDGARPNRHAHRSP